MRTEQTASHWGVYDVTVKDDSVVEVSSRDQHASAMIQSLPAVVTGPLRVRRPAIREGWLRNGPRAKTTRRGADRFVEVSWDEAIKLVANEIERVRKEFGAPSIYGGSMGWASAGRFHHAPSVLKRFLNHGGGFTDKFGNYSFGAAMVLLPHVIGQHDVTASLSNWPSVVSSCRLLVMFGGAALKNAQIESGGTAGHTSQSWLRRLGSQGIRIVNCSPVRSDTAPFLNAEWLSLRPNTDTALMLALAYVLVTEKLADEAFLERYCVGHAKFFDYVLGKDDGVAKNPNWAAEITGVSADRIVSLAREMAATRTLITVSWSVQRADHGEQPYWAAIALAACLGQIGLPGGGVGFGYAATDGTAAPRIRGLPRPKLPLGQNPIATSVPACRIADMLLNPGATYHFNGQARTYPDVRLVYWCGGNPFHHHQDLNRLVEAWQRPETIIVHEPWWTATARFADIVLPCTTTMERNDIMAAELGSTYVAMRRVIPPVAEARDDFSIFVALAEQLGYSDAYTEGRSEMDWLRHMYNGAAKAAKQLGYELPSFDQFWDAGIYTFPTPTTPFDFLADYRADPVANSLATPSGRIEIWSERIANMGYDDCPGLPSWLEPAEWLGSKLAEKYPLHLLSNQPATRLHSQLDHSPLSAGGKIHGREPLTMNAQDAQRRRIKAGDIVRVFNDRGACLAGAILSEGIRPGVVQMATGAWYDPEVPGASGTLDKHGNPNVLTLDKGTSKLSQSTSAQSVLVEVELWDKPLPALSAFDPPVFSEG